MYKNYVKCSADKRAVSYFISDVATGENNTNVKVYPCEGESRLAHASFIQQQIKTLAGEVLTIIDASMPENSQQKSVKDLIRKAFMDRHYEVSQFLDDQKALQEMIENMPEEDFENLEPVDISEVLGA